MPRMQTTKRLSVAAGVIWLCAAAWLAEAAPAAGDTLQKAVNYVFTGKLDPKPAPEITDRDSCIVVMRDPKWNRYIRYYLSRFDLGDARFVRTYSGRDARYHLHIDNDVTVIEYLGLDKKTVSQGYKSADIPLPGNIDQAKKALDLIAARCTHDAPAKGPF